MSEPAETKFQSKTTSKFSKFPTSPSFYFRLLLVAGLTILMTAMQVEFYREHDILPGYALALAVASELAFISLVTMQFRQGLDWLRIAIYLIFFGYFISALSYHVFAKTRSKAIANLTLNTGSAAELDLNQQLSEAKQSLKIATKGRSWKNIELFGAEISKIQDFIRELPKDDALGISAKSMLVAEAVLLILLRAMLMAASALNTIRLREYLKTARSRRPAIQ